MNSNLRRHDRNMRGFTLLEMLVAFVIAGLGLTALLSGHRLALDGGNRAETRLSATLMAQDILSAAGASYALEPGVTAGTENGYDWQVEIEPFEESGSGTPATMKIRATVTHKGRSTTLETLRLGEARP